MTLIARLITSAALTLPAMQVFAADFDAAAYHDQSCTRCHDSGVYTRDNRRVRNHAMLEAQVARCDAMLETKLFPDDLSLLVEHLNSTYYKFNK